LILASHSSKRRNTLVAFGCDEPTKEQRRNKEEETNLPSPKNTSRRRKEWNKIDTFG
jgi:predicted house-cleaning NTP pyrophosphatase (Maf/HAM1 superfamily)